MEDRIRVGILMGGKSAERSVSLASGCHVCQSFDPARYEIYPIEIGGDAKWYLHHPDSPLLEKGHTISASVTRGEGYAPPSAEHSELVTARVVRSRVDIIFPALHGPGGEDGTLQGFLETLSIPYVGSKVLASALTMDKARCKVFLRAMGLPTPDWIFIRRSEWEKNGPDLVDRILAEMPGGCVIKPNDQGSSIGVAHVAAGLDPTEAIRSALSWSAEVLVEKTVTGREFTCGVYGKEEPEALPVTEIRTASGFFDYTAKYQAGLADEVTPAEIPAELAKEIQTLAVAAHGGFGCAGITRTDFLLENGAPTIIEVNTIPGMSRVSLIPRACQAMGIEFSQILDRLVGEVLFRDQLATVG
jgi:D-alanine-D-alanine ligase